MVLFLFSLGATKKITGVQKDIDNSSKGFLRMIPDDRHRIVEANSNLTITCTYVFQDENESFNHQNFSWRWELPSFLTKYPEVSCIDNWSEIKSDFLLHF